MTVQQTYQIFQHKQKLTIMLLVFFLGMGATNILLDYLFTLFRNSAFYISESLLFSSYWALYLPLLPLLLNLIKRTKSFGWKLAFVSGTIAIHLLVYPALVWLVSKVCYEHTFSYWQTFNFGLSAYFIKTVVIYGFSLLAFTMLNRKANLSQLASREKTATEKQNFISSILVSINNKKVSLSVNDIFYFSANSPYVSIYHLSKRYLCAETLKSLENQLDENQFVRIHKSHIINLQKITSYQSRQNGDYDVFLSDGTILRVSRNYAQNFKSKFADVHQLSLK